ncbi:MAG: hypothetical protein PSY14_11120 [bacterium]|nr:hypothetical protein [bacterium]
MISADMYEGDYSDPAPAFLQRTPTVKKEPLSLKDAFNNLHPAMENSSSLRVLSSGIYAYYDFAQRVRSSGSPTPTITPFSQLDRDTLVAARDKLVELGGNPPELPSEAPTLNKQLRGLNP